MTELHSSSGETIFYNMLLNEALWLFSQLCHGIKSHTVWEITAGVTVDDKPAYHPTVVFNNYLASLTCPVENQK